MASGPREEGSPSGALHQDALEAARFPTRRGTAAPWTLAGRDGMRYGELTPAQDELFRTWVEKGHARPWKELKEGVFLAGELVAKFFPAPSNVRGMLRESTAARAAKLARWIDPIPTPRPVLAVAGVGPEESGSLWVSEYIPGPSFESAWDADPAAREALPAFLAEMHERGIYHGDLHPGNLIWNDGRLVLIDVTALRRGLHLLFARKLADAQWARLLLYLGDVEALRACYSTYADLRGWESAEAGWRRVVDHTRRLMQRRKVLPPRAPRLD